MSNGSDFDVVVIGAGPGGYVSAIRAGQLGARVAVIEKDKLGGTCLNNGCIPSKAILASAELIYRIKEADKLNIKVEGKVGFDWAGVQERKDKVLETLRRGVGQLFKANKITLFEGVGRLKDANSVMVEDKSGGGSKIICGRKIIIATGSKPTMIPGWPMDGRFVVTSEEALHWETLPESLLIVGGGVIGVEFACMMNEFGVKTIIVEMLEELLPNLDFELGGTLRKIFDKRGIKTFVGTKVDDLKIEDEKVRVRLNNGEQIEVDRVLVATGRKANTEDVGLESVGVKTTDKGFIKVDDRLMSSVEGVYCIGDANGLSLLAHSASAQGIVSAENACGGNIRYEGSAIPSCIYTFPEIGSVGLSEKEARESGYEIKVGKFPIGYLGKALATGHTEGFVKVIRDKANDMILGVHIIGHNATEWISAGVVAMHSKMSVRELSEVVFAHPTMSEALKESAENSLSLAIHLPPAKIAKVMAEVGN